MFSRRSKIGLEHRDLLFQPTLTYTCVQIRSQSRWVLGGQTSLQHTEFLFRRHASSASSRRWQTRQARDSFAINARVQGLKSRAAFKLLEVSKLKPAILSMTFLGKSCPLNRSTRSMKNTRYSVEVRQLWIWYVAFPKINTKP